MTTKKWLETFFEEKQVPFQQWSIAHRDNIHIIDNEMVIEIIKNHCSKNEQEQIQHKLRQIDFANGDVNHFLKHLAEGYVRANY